MSSPFRHPRRAIATAMLVVAALALTACSSTGADPTTPSDSPDGVSIGRFGGETLQLSEPLQGGEFVLGNSFSVPTLDPVEPFGGSTEFAMQAVYDRLMEMQPDGSVGPGIAESLSTEDNIVWTLVLPDDVTFTDGTPFDAAAVIAHITRVGAEDSASSSARDARSITSAEALDATTVRFTLAAPNRQFDMLLATGAMSLVPSPTAVEERGDRFGLHPVGAGAFIVDSFTPDGEIVFHRNPDYRIEGLPYVDTLRMIPVLDEASRISAIVSGDIDAATLTQVNLLEEATAQGATALRQPWYSALMLFPNLQGEFLGDLRVREGLNHAVDRDALNAVVFDGLHQAMSGVLTPDHPYAKDTGWPSYDLEAAMRLIDEVKAELGVT